MESNAFFRWIWRLNGIFILVASLAILGFIAYEFFRSLNRVLPEQPVVVNVAEDPTGREKWVLGRMERLAGTEFSMVRLISENDQVAIEKQWLVGAGSRYLDLHSGPAKNVLFVNTSLNTSHWLFPSNQQIVSSVQQFPVRNLYEEKPETTAKVVFYEIVENDSNGDGVKNKKDKLSLAVSKPSGQGFRVLLREFDSIIGKNLSDDGDAIIMYQIGGIAHSMLLNLASFEIVSTKPLPKVENS